jgi:hypothetical protein
MLLGPSQAKLAFRVRRKSDRTFPIIDLDARFPGSCIANRFCICVRYLACHYNLRGYIWWPLQSLRDYQLRRLQRIPSAQGH